jgi:flagellar secretion chaperone FliS
MYAQKGAAQYRAVRSHGLVADASPARLVQIMLEHILADLATAHGCMQRIKNNLPLSEVVAKGKSLNKAIRLIDQLNATLDMERGQHIAQNLRQLYLYMLERLTQANVHNDAGIVAEIVELVRKVKSGWDPIVAGELDAGGALRASAAR